MKKYYECHITIEPHEAANAGEARMFKDAVRESVEQTLGIKGWKFSAIDGDPLLGAGTKFYATTHFSARRPLRWVCGELDTMCAFLSIACDYRILRRKIELVVYDVHEETSV